MAAFEAGTSAQPLTEPVSASTPLSSQRDSVDDALDALGTLAEDLDNGVERVIVRDENAEIRIAGNMECFRVGVSLEGWAIPTDDFEFDEDAIAQFPK